MAGEAYATADDFVFAGPVGQPLRPSALSKSFQLAVNAAKAPKLTLYGLRHTFVTLLLEAGENLKVVSELLGHSTIAVTAAHYAHVRPQVAEQAILRLGAFVAG